MYTGTNRNEQDSGGFESFEKEHVSVFVFFPFEQLSAVLAAMIASSILLPSDWLRFSIPTPLVSHSNIPN